MNLNGRLDRLEGLIPRPPEGDPWDALPCVRASSSPARVKSYLAGVALAVARDGQEAAVAAVDEAARFLAENGPDRVLDLVARHGRLVELRRRATALEYIDPPPGPAWPEGSRCVGWRTDPGAEAEADRLEGAWRADCEAAGLDLEGRLGLGCDDGHSGMDRLARRMALGHPLHYDATGGVRP